MQRLAQVKYVVTTLRALTRGPTRSCCVCGYTGRFHAAGQPPRYGARCPQCLSLERQRLLVLCDREQNLFAGRRILHFAPERSTSRYIESTEPARYDRADIEASAGQLTLDLEHLALDDASYDVIVASHVLEHVVDDQRALGEIARVLAPDGVAVLMVPLVEGWDVTYENPAIQSRAERTEHFGQFNHVRWYGRDFRTRVEAAGFEIDEFVAVEPLVHTYGLDRGERVFVCRLAS